MSYLDKAAAALERATEEVKNLTPSGRPPVLLAVSAAYAELELISRGKVPARLAGQLVTAPEPESERPSRGGW